jgi:hypothetical protein
MRALKVALAVLIVVLLVAPTIASATYSVYIAYNYTMNSASGYWKVGAEANRGSMLGPWDSWSNSSKDPATFRNLYCVEPNVYESTGAPHTFNYDPKSTGTWNPPNGGTNAGLQWAAYLVASIDPYQNSGNQLTRAALQMAVWEALYDYTAGYGGTSNATRFSTGEYRVNSNTGVGAYTASDVKSKAAYYLNNFQGQCNYGTVLHDGQDLLKVDVPEPGSLMLLGGVLLGAASLAWRRRRRS